LQHPGTGPVVSVFVEKLHGSRKNSLLVKASGPTGRWLGRDIQSAISGACLMAHETTKLL